MRFDTAMKMAEHLNAEQRARVRMAKEGRDLVQVDELEELDELEEVDELEELEELEAGELRVDVAVEELATLVCVDLDTLVLLGVGGAGTAVSLRSIVAWCGEHSTRSVPSVIDSVDRLLRLRELEFSYEQQGFVLTDLGQSQIARLAVER